MYGSLRDPFMYQIGRITGPYGTLLEVNLVIRRGSRRDPYTRNVGHSGGRRRARARLLDFSVRNAKHSLFLSQSNRRSFSGLRLPGP